MHLARNDSWRLLHAATRDDLCAKPRLVEIQNQIVDPRFRANGYRTDQNYVGETVHYGHERIHYVCPGPELVEGLMSGVVAAHRLMESSGVHPVLHAALVGYGFVFVHPFGDGNGRIHRLLIHNVLARRGRARRHGLPGLRRHAEAARGVRRVA